MFSLVVLFTVFLGLVGVLVVVSEWQRKWAARAGDPGINLQLLHNWLFDHDCHAPTPEEVIQMLNRAVCKRVHSEVRMLSVLLTGKMYLSAVSVVCCAAYSGLTDVLL